VEHVCDVNLQQNFAGKKVNVTVEVISESNNHCKFDWYFEAVSIVVNGKFEG
jgi:hypothetical protein